MKEKSEYALEKEHKWSVDLQITFEVVSDDIFGWLDEVVQNINQVMMEQKLISNIISAEVTGDEAYSDLGEIK